MRKGVIITSLPKFPIHKGVPDASLLSEIVLQKYEYHMPFYRQIKVMAHMGMTGLMMVGWYKRTMEFLSPLYDALIAEVFRSRYIQTDESTVPVINNERHQADKEYLWMSLSVMERLVVFFYDDASRAGDVIKTKTDKYYLKDTCNATATEAIHQPSGRVPRCALSSAWCIYAATGWRPGQKTARPRNGSWTG